MDYPASTAAAAAALESQPAQPAELHAIDINALVASVQTLVIKLKAESTLSHPRSKALAQANKLKSVIEKNFNEQKPLFPLSKQGTQLSAVPQLVRNVSAGNDELSVLAEENRQLSELLEDYLQVLNLVISRHRAAVLHLSKSHLKLIDQLSERKRQGDIDIDKTRSEELNRRAALACVEMNEWLTEMETKEEITSKKMTRLEKENEILRELLKESLGAEVKRHSNSDESPNATPIKDPSSYTSESTA